MVSKLLLVSACLFGLCAAEINAQSIFSFQENNKVNFEYDVDFSYQLDNRSFDRSSSIFVESELLNLMRLSPSVGLSVNGRSGSHKVMLGIDVMKEFGNNPTSIVLFSDDENDSKLRNLKLFQEIFAYYNYRIGLGDGIFNMYAGIFSNKEREGYYSRSILSDKQLMYDPNIEGLLFKYRTDRLYAELGGDFMGTSGLDRMTSIMAFSSGQYRLLNWLSLGWDASYNYVGSSDIILNDVRNAIFNPWVGFDLSGITGLQELDIKAGALASYQNDKLTTGIPACIPVGAEVVLKAKMWGFGIEDTFFYGDNMMPYKSSKYTDYYVTSLYNDLLYLGEPYYYTHRGYASFNNRTELYWEPEITDFIKLRVSVGAYFIQPGEDIGMFIGWQQKAGVVFNLDAIRHPSSTSAKKKRNVYGQSYNI